MQREIHDYHVYPVPDGQEWRLGLLKSLMEIRLDNWEVMFDDEDNCEMIENDIDRMINDVCSS